MSNAPRAKRGFTLLEAMAAVVVLGIGIVMSLGAFSTATRVEDNARQTERMQRMAQGKLTELVATGQATASSSGNFADDGAPDITWSLEVNSSGITDLNSVSITVEPETGGTRKPRARLDTLVYVPQTTDAATTGGATGQ